MSSESKRTRRTRLENESRRRHPETRLLTSARRRAAAGGYECSLTVLEVMVIIGNQRCEFCGRVLPLAGFRGACSALSPTLDRLDPRRGYTLDNTVLACHLCNSRKRDFTPAELRALADTIDAVQARVYLRAFPKSEGKHATTLKEDE